MKEVLDFIIARPSVALIIIGAIIFLLYFASKVGVVVLRSRPQKYLLAIGLVLVAGGVIWTLRGSNNEVLAPTWLHQDESIQVLDNQVLIKLRNVTPDGHFATIDVSLPGAPDFGLSSVETGARRDFDFNGKKYRLAVLQIRDSGARIEIHRRF